MAQEYVTQDGEVVTEASALVALDSKLAVDLAKAEIDQQIATAKQYPRLISKVASNVLSLVTLDQQAAEEAMYALPRGGKPIVGPSIRLAEIISSQWGNCRVAARVVDVNRTEKYVEAEGVFHDLETNSATKATVRRRIVDKYGKLYNDDMIIVTGNAACSIARRNAILAGVPKAVWRKAYEAAEQAVKGDIKTLAERRDQMFKAFAAFGVKPEQIYAALGVGGSEDITLDSIPILTGMYQAIKNGEATVEQMFDPRQIGSTHKTVSDPLNDEGPAPKGPRGSTARQAEADHVENADGETVKDRDAPADTKPAGGDKVDPAPNSAAEPDKAASVAAAGAEQASHGDEADADTGEGPTAAYLAGRDARKRGLSGRTVPAEFAGDDTAAGDWVAGWKDENAEQKAGGEK